MMEKLNNNKKNNKYAKGALILLIGGIICKLLGAFYRIPLTNILGAEGIGVYQLIFPIYSLFLVFISGGIPIALSKIVAECRARNELLRAKRFLWQSVLYLVILSFVVSLFFIVFAGFLAKLQGNVFAKLGYLAVSGAVFFASVLTAFRGYFQGFQEMLPTAISQIFEQIFKLVLGLVFAFILIKYGIAYGVLGAILGIVISELLSLIYLIITYFLKHKKDSLNIYNSKKTDKNTTEKIEENYLTDFKFLFKKAFPITLTASILPLILAVDSFLIINLLTQNGLNNSISTQMFGIYSGMVNSLINLPTVVSLALAVSLVPAISYRNERKEDIGDLISSSIKIVLFIAIPSIFLFSFFPNEIIRLLYPKAVTVGFLDLGANLLKISSINIFYISLLQVSTAMLQASNKGLISLINLSFAGVIKVVLTILFVLSPLNIYGAAVSSIMCFAFSSSLNLIALKNDFKFILKVKSFLYILFSSFTMTGVIFGTNFLLSFLSDSFYMIILSIIVGGIFYIISILMLPVFNEQELAKIPFSSILYDFKNKLNIKFRIKKS